MTTEDGKRGFDLYSVAFERGAVGCWYAWSPGVPTFFRALSIREPAPGTRVRGIWLASGRENELAALTPPELFDDSIAHPEHYHWSDNGQLPSRSLVTLLIDGEVGGVFATFRTKRPSIRL
jgi:hypothetical protein